MIWAVFWVRVGEEWWGRVWERVVSGCLGEGHVYYHHVELRLQFGLDHWSSQSLLHVKILWGAL